MLKEILDGCEPVESYKEYRTKIEAKSASLKLSVHDLRHKSDMSRVLYISKEFQNDIQYLLTSFNSSLWMEHYASNSIASRNWESHFYNEEERDIFIERVLALCSTMRMIDPHSGSIDPTPHESLMTLSAACNPAEWLMNKLMVEKRDVEENAGGLAWMKKNKTTGNWERVKYPSSEFDRITQDVRKLIQDVMERLNKMYQVFCLGRRSGYYE